MIVAAVLLLLHARDVDVYFNDRMIPMDAKPIVRGSRVLVPLRGVAEALGANVRYVEGENKVFLKRGDRTVEMSIRSAEMMANMKPVRVDQPPMVVGGRVLVPLRFVSQYLGAKVTWHAAKRRVDISL
ncbi:hypothetical protein BH11ARM2_BH11ARM2_05240 [soil metagenome]